MGPGADEVHESLAGEPPSFDTVHLIPLTGRGGDGKISFERWLLEGESASHQIGRIITNGCE